ncbi:Protein tesmin/TSO1-like CXC 6 [Thelohanellus kitauei]|uniref:Protein tesmin/TSO1-like CXC 6 n=1 Tax=Thelohanellus kitauei TaxID=669202 RepID=A0A0C2JAP2_THEKT|nr:Protein tesmin/TSO1-like CXC 6 [Thelohanellus kitauei]
MKDKFGSNMNYEKISGSNKSLSQDPRPVPDHFYSYFPPFFPIPPVPPMYYPMPYDTPIPFQQQETSNKEDSPNKRVCSCDKTSCLKLYCECFKSGLMCDGCNCKNCRNDVKHKRERERAINNIISKNKDAFKSKVTFNTKAKVTQHRNGCHCSKSNCLKGYCECFQNKIFCGKNCRCVECHNTESFQRNSERNSESINEPEMEYIGTYGCDLSDTANYRPVEPKRPVEPIYPVNRPPFRAANPEYNPLMQMADVAVAQLFYMNKQIDTRYIISQNIDLIMSKISNLLFDVIHSRGIPSSDIEEQQVITQVLECFKWCLTTVLNHKKKN